MGASIFHRMDDQARREARLVAAAATVSLVLSPIMAVWSIALGVPTALLAWAVDRFSHRTAARTVMLIALGVVLGALPYIVAGALMAVL